MRLDRWTRIAAMVCVTMVAAVSCASAGSPNDNRTLRWGWSMPTSWDPVTSSTGNDVNVLSLAYSALTQLDKNGNAIPGLAESWKYNGAGTEITFTLRGGLRFSDGAGLDSSAVKKSLERGRDAKNSRIADQLRPIVDIATPDQRTVTLRLAAADYQIPNLLAGKTGMIVSPTADIERLATNPVGAGPFTISEFVPGSHANFRKNPDYWNSQNIYLERIEVKDQPEPATIVANLQSGALDVATIPAGQVEAAKKAGLKIDVIPSLSVSVIDIHSGMKPFGDPRVTEALKYAVDRQSLVDTMTFGYGVVNIQPFPKGYVGYNSALDGLYPYDPDKAKRLLADAGYPNGFDLKITASEGAQIAELLQGQLAKVGIRSTISVIPPGASTKQQIVYINREAAFHPDGFVGRESPVQALSVVYGPEGLMNPGRTTPPELLAVLDQIRRTPLDHPDYPKLVQEATAIGVRTMPNVFLYSSPRIFARSSRVSALPHGLAVQRFEGVRIAS